MCQIMKGNSKEEEHSKEKTSLKSFLNVKYIILKE